jgi:hypothetical protein
MSLPRSDDRPQTGATQASAPQAHTQPKPATPVVDSAPPLVPSREQSPWWSAPSGKPFRIPDFAHELAVAFLAAVLAWLFPPRPVPVRVKARPRR